MAIRSYLVGCGGVNGWGFLFIGNVTRYKSLMVSVYLCVRVCDMRNKLLMVSVHFVCVCDVVFC